MQAADESAALRRAGMAREDSSWRLRIRYRTADVRRRLVLPRPFIDGENLSFAHCPGDSLAGVLLSHLPQILAKRRCLMIEGRATLRGCGILYRSALYPLSDDGTIIDHVLGAANWRPLRENEQLISPLVRTKW